MNCFYEQKRNREIGTKKKTKKIKAKIEILARARYWFVIGGHVGYK